MKDKEIIRKILSLTIPAVVTNVTTPLLALCDVAIVGHMESAAYIAAIAVGGTMFNMLYWLCGFLRMGSSGTTAQAYGAKETQKAFAILYRGLILSLIIGVTFILFHRAIAEGVMSFIDAEGSARVMAIEYFDICIWGAPAVLATFVLTGWFLGMQNSKIPMWVSIFINVFNIAVSLTLVFVFGFRIEGVAIGTLSAQWAGMVMALVIGFRHYGIIHVDIETILNAKEIKRYFKINTDIFMRTLCLVTVTLWFTRTGAQQGTLMLAVNALLMQLFTIFSYMMDGMAFAAEALCGRHMGEARNDMLNRTVRALIKMGLTVSAIFTIAYFVGGDGFLKMLSSDGEVIERADEYFAWAVSIPLISFMAFVWDGVMIGLTRTRAMLASMAGGAAVFFAAYFILFPKLGNHGLWIAFLGYLFVRGAILTFAGRHYLYSSK